MPLIRSVVWLVNEKIGSCNMVSATYKTHAKLTMANHLKDLSCKLNNHTIKQNKPMTKLRKILRVGNTLVSKLA